MALLSLTRSQQKCWFDACKNRGSLFIQNYTNIFKNKYFPCNFYKWFFIFLFSILFLWNATSLNYFTMSIANLYHIVSFKHNFSNLTIYVKNCRIWNSLLGVWHHQREPRVLSFRHCSPTHEIAPSLALYTYKWRALNKCRMTQNHNLNPI